MAVSFEGCACGNGGGGTPGESCCAPSITTTALCRASDCSTVLVVMRSGCVDCGAAPTVPEVVGWTDPATGVFTPGAAPAGLGSCDGCGGCADTVCVTRCDDTDGDGLADTTYTELWCIKQDGTTELLFTYQGDPSTPYTPVAPVACEHGTIQCHTQVLCDDTGSFLRRYTFASNGQATYQDVNLDGQTPHLVTGTVQDCAQASDCDQPREPAATVGLCLADGTPIAVVVTRDCQGVTREEGWINLTTGAYSTGQPPAGAVACGESRSISTTGTFCDVDANGNVVGLVLIEYTYAADGSVSSVRLIDATTGQTYTAQGTITTCPAGVDQPEQDLVVLCDIAADGSVTRFIRDYRRDENGQIVGHTDYTLDGANYQPTGTVDVCGGEPTEPCRNTTTLLLCDLPTDGEPTPTVTDNDPGAYYPYPTGVATAGAQVLWDGGPLDLPQAAGPQPGTTGTVRTAAATIQAPRPVCDAGTAHVSVQVDAAQLGPDDGCASTGFIGLYNGPGEANRIALDLAPKNTPAGWMGTLTVEADVPAADLAAGNIVFALAFDAYDDSGGTCPGVRHTSWQLSQFRTTVVYDQTGCATQFLRNVITDCETGAVLTVTDTTLDGQPYTVTGEPGQCQATGGGQCCTEPEPPCPVAFGTECAVLIENQWSYDNTSGFNGEFSDCGSITGPSAGGASTGASIPCTGTFQITSWLINGEEVVSAPVTFQGGPCGDNTGAGMHDHWAALLTQLDPSATWETAFNDSCAYYVRTLGAPDGTVYGQMIIRDATDTTKVWTLGPNNSESSTYFTKVFTQECGGTVTVSWLDEDGQPITAPAGDVRPCGDAADCPVQQMFQTERCDDTDGDGIADAWYVELVGVNCLGALTSLGTYTCDLSAPYTPVSPVDCDSPDPVAERPMGVQARRVELTAGQVWQASRYGTLRTVQTTAHGGTGTITTADGVSTLFDGETAEWEISRDMDVRLIGPLTIQAATGVVTVNFTTGVDL